MPLFLAKKEVFAWLKSGAKTIDVRKGPPSNGEVAKFQCGANHLTMFIIKKETGSLSEVIRQDNYRKVIPTARSLDEALWYLRRIYGRDEGTFTAYHLTQPKQ